MLIYISKEEILPIHKTDSPPQFLSLFENTAAKPAAVFFRFAGKAGSSSKYTCGYIPKMPAGIRIFLRAFSLSRSGKKSMKKM